MVEKHDFVELEFTGMVKDGEIFDTNVDSVAKSIGMKDSPKPLIVCIGKRMVIDGLDEFLEKKEIGKDYEVEILPEKAFGKRKKDLVKLMPAKSFLEKNISPKPGMVLALDNYMVRIVAVSGGRVLVDFNNPLSGKEVVYKFKLKRKVDDLQEKVKAISNFFFKKEVEFEVSDKKLIFNLPETYESLVKQLNEDFKEVLGLEITIGSKK